MNTGKSKKVPEMALFLLQKFLKIYIIYLQNIKSKSTAKASLLYFSQHQKQMIQSAQIQDTESKHRTQNTKTGKKHAADHRVFFVCKK